MSLHRRLSIAGATLALLVVCVCTTIANISAQKNPELALKFWPADGRARAVFADALLEVDNGDRRKTREMATEALISEPISPRAVRALGFIEDEAGRTGKAREFLLLADRLSRRDLATNLWLLEDAVQRNDLAGALRRYDIALRTSSLAENILFPILSEALADPAVLSSAVALFRQNPPWLERFFYEAIGHDRALPALARIFVSLPRNAPSLTLALKARLLTRLIDTGDLRAAHILYGNVSGDQGTGLIRATRFQSEALWPPFDWELTSNSDFGAEIDGTGKGLLTYSSSGLGGVVARQLIALTPGTYRISSIARIADGMDLIWRVWCTKRGSQALVELLLPSGIVSTRPVSGGFSVPATQECSYQWLSLELRANPDSHGLESQVREVLIEPSRP